MKDFELEVQTLKEVKRQEAKELADMLNQAKEEGVGIVHIFDEYLPKGGMTIAFRKCSPYANTRMVEVAVAVCSPEDTFNKRIGNRIALDKFFAGITIELPILLTASPENLNHMVKTAFNSFYYSL